jgi:hypothetical protein
MAQEMENCNPFVDTSGLNLPLHQEIRQRIHFTALQRAAHGHHLDTIPGSVPITQIMQLACYHGASVYFAHPFDIDRIFAGVTLKVYQAIERLYCDRIGRSIRTVWRILDAMANQVGAPGIDYEAVWAICAYLDEQRTDVSDVTVEQIETTWQVAQISPDVWIQSEETTYQPVVVCLLTRHPSQVIAFRIGNEEDLKDNLSLTIYDALVSLRRPSAEGAAGLTWQIPTKISAERELPKYCQQTCNRLGISIQQVDESSTPLLKSLRGNWARDLAGKVLSKKRFTLLLDNYLRQVHGHGPLRGQLRRNRKFARRIGYNRDPAWQFPALCGFLPAHESAISADGSVEHDGLHYENELLAHWPGQQVILRRSETAEALAWVYLDEEILCQALARELRRKDGTYRANRPRR